MDCRAHLGLENTTAAVLWPTDVPRPLVIRPLESARLPSRLSRGYTNVAVLNLTAGGKQPGAVLQKGQLLMGDKYFLVTYEGGLAKSALEGPR